MNRFTLFKIIQIIGYPTAGITFYYMITNKQNDSDEVKSLRAIIYKLRYNGKLFDRKKIEKMSQHL